MGDITVKSGALNEGKTLLVNAAATKPPFVKGCGIISYNFVVTTDYTSGDNIIIEVDAATSILVAVGVTHVGAIVQYAEAALSAPRTGKKLTWSNVTSDQLKVLIIYGV